MDRIVNFFAFITVVVLGLSAGAMLTEAIVFVSFWQSLSPSEFLKWFAENEPLLVQFFGSLQTISAILILATTVLFWLRNHRGKYLAAFALLLVIGVIALFFIYFQNVNASFVKATIAIDNVKSELSWWKFWQWVRTVLGIGAIVSAIFSIWRER